MKEILEIDSDLFKARSHKYIKRTGSPGNYKYWYKLPDGRLVSSDDPASPQTHLQAKIEHLTRLIQAKAKGHHQMTRGEMLAHAGVSREDLDQTHNKHIFNNAHRRGHQFDEHEIQTAHTVEEQSKEESSAPAPSVPAPARPARRTRAARPAAATPAPAAATTERVFNSRIKRTIESVLQQKLNGHQISILQTNPLSQRAKEIYMSGVDADEAAKQAFKEFKDAGKITESSTPILSATRPEPQPQAQPQAQSEEQDILRQLKELGIDLTSPQAQAEPTSAPVAEASRQRAQQAADIIRQESRPRSRSHTALAQAQPNEDFVQADAPVTRMVEAQASGNNAYLARAKEIFSRIKNDVKPARKQIVEHLLQAIEQAGSTLNEETILQKYKEISGRRVQGLSNISEEFERGTFVGLDEIIRNEPIDIEVERFKRGYAAKQYARLKPFVKDSWHQANPSAPPPMPTWGDLKSWSEQGGEKPEWAGTTRTAVPKEVFDASVKKADGKPAYPPGWMPIHLMPAWNYIVKKSGDKDPYQTQAARFNQDQSLNLGSQAEYQEGIAKAALRKYVQMRGDSQLIDIPKSKLSEVGLTHEEIFKSLDKGMSQLLANKIIDPVALVPFIDAAIEEQKKPAKKSFSLVVDLDAPAYLGKRGLALQKSKLIEKIKMLKKSV